MACRLSRQTRKLDVRPVPRQSITTDLVAGAIKRAVSMVHARQENLAGVMLVAGFVR